MIEVNFYHFANGECPIDDYLENLDVKMRAKVLRTIGLLEKFGAQLRLPHSEYLEDGIFELRVKQSTNIERVLYFFLAGNNAILTNGFSKKQNKTPRSELQIAKDRRNDYMRRYKR